MYLCVAAPTNGVSPNPTPSPAGAATTMDHRLTPSYFRRLLHTPIVQSITHIAITSRLCVIIIQFLANSLMPDHQADAFVSPQNKSDIRSLDWFSNALLGGFRRWDAHHYLHIAQYDYTFEHSLAFYPLFPFLINILTTPATHLLPLLSFRELALVIAIVLNIFFFVQAAHTLYSLTVHHIKHHAAIAVLLFCLNPASIFFTAPYTESLFSWLSFSVMLCASQRRFGAALWPLCASIACRSNGFINLGFVLFFGGMDWLAELYRTLKEKEFRWKQHTVVLKMIGAIGTALFTFFLIQYYQYYKFCVQIQPNIPGFLKEHAIAKGYVVPGGNLSEWCGWTVPIAYSYVQNHYWNVGFLQYYEWKQVPNFLLASPMVIVMMLHLLYWPNWKTSFVFMAHATFLLIVCVLCINVQVTTRLMASASPVLYWIFSTETSSEIKTIHDIPMCKWPVKLVLLWFASYIIIGTTLFCNFLPWT